ncbi:MAG: ATP-binding protein [Clostridia bacterium]
MSLENFYPSKDKFTLALKMNNLLASPSFKTWLEGVPLNINRFLYSDDGKPNVSIFSIAHLSESERMFFVSMLLNELITWMRTQPGTGSLRAILYMDDMYGYLPPVANPPSKKLFMTLLKQARAYGLGLVLSTQNPVDLDYKALSNTGTWFIGRLQTERDKERVIAGLQGASVGGEFNKSRVESILAGLKQRVFYLHNVHEKEPLIFNTRWVLSYLAGPLTREQISLLPKENITRKAGSLNVKEAKKNCAR